MYKKFSTTTYLALLIVFLLSGCATQKDIRQQPKPMLSQTEFQEIIAQGDTFFAQMHLYGWRKAAEYYRNAYALKKTTELRDKRFLTLCLIVIRQYHEKIVNQSAYEELDTLGNFPKNQKQQYLFDIVTHYRSLPVARDSSARVAAKEKKELDASLFDLENSPLDAYLVMYCLNYYTCDLRIYNDELLQLLKKYPIQSLIAKYSAHPLFIYFNYPARGAQVENAEEQYGHFAEYFVYKANELFKNNKLKQAAVYYRKVLESIPDYTEAINGLGNIYYFTIQDYDTAITYYQNTLDLDHTNPVALFGKAVSLHYLGKYQESNQVLDYMLANQELYHGEATYYKAYNYYHLQDHAAAREWIDRAKELLPNAGEVDFLSGLLYFNRGNKKEAENDFLSVLDDDRYPHYYPLYYVGMAKLERQDWTLFKDFSDSIQAFEGGISSIEEQIKKIADLELEEYQRQWMVRQQTQKLTEFKIAAKQVIEQMEQIMAQNADRKKAIETQSINANIAAMKALLQKNPHRLNAREPKENGNTLLHKAVIAGQKEVVDLLLERGAQVHITDDGGYTPLSWAVILGHVEIAHNLITKNAPVNNKGPAGMTLLHEAAYNGNKEMVKLLLDHGAVLDAREEFGKTPMDLAVERQKYDVLPLLKPLHESIQKRDIPGLKKLIQRYPDWLEGRDEKGRTPLHLAAGLGAEDLATLLLDAGVYMEARDMDGLTPLESAMRNQRQVLVQLLKNRGAAPTNQEILARPLAEKEAVLWHLGGLGWGMRTRSHFIVFDYAPYPSRLRLRPAQPLLGNGQLNPLELKDQPMMCLLTHEIINVEEQNPIQKLQRDFPRMIVVNHDKSAKDPGVISIAPGEKKSLDNIEIISVPARAGNNIQGYGIASDGLHVFYMGCQNNWNQEMWPAFTHEVDVIAQAMAPMDIVFFPISGQASVLNDLERAMIEKGIRYLSEKLHPHLLIFLTTEGEESAGVQFTKDIIQKGITTPSTVIRCAAVRGDRFIYPDQPSQ